MSNQILGSDIGNVFTVITFANNHNCIILSTVPVQGFRDSLCLFNFTVNHIYSYPT